MTSALRKQQERSRYTHEGSKRVEIILDADTLAALDMVMKRYGITRQQAVCDALKNAV